MTRLVHLEDITKAPGVDTHSHLSPMPHGLPRTGHKPRLWCPQGTVTVGLPENRLGFCGTSGLTGSSRVQEGRGTETVSMPAMASSHGSQGRRRCQRCVTGAQVASFHF